MSRTYQVVRNNSDLQGAKKVWVLHNKRGAKKFQQMINKRCRRLDKIAIAEGINDMVDNVEELFVNQYEEDYYEDWYDETQYEDDPWHDPFEDWYDRTEELSP